MKSFHSIIRIVRQTAAAAVLATAINAATAGDLGATIDDFSNSQKNSLGIDRQYVTDTAAGGQTTMLHRVEDGVLSVSGNILPPRGQPGWASTVLLLDPQGLPRDASAYKGIRLLVKINRGNFSISANSTEITNFDYHAAAVTRQRGNEFHEVKIPFTEMKRAWSEQTPLNTATLASISLVAFDLQKGSFDFEIAEVGFY